MMAAQLAVFLPRQVIKGSGADVPKFSDLAGVTFTNWGAGYNGESERIFATEEGMKSILKALHIQEPFLLPVALCKILPPSGSSQEDTTSYK